MKSPRAHLDVVRPGIALFDVEPSASICKEPRPVMQVRTELSAVARQPDLLMSAEPCFAALIAVARPQRDRPVAQCNSLLCQPEPKARGEARIAGQ